MDIIVFSHLRWNFVYQRPQQILSRLAKRYRVIYIEEEWSSDSPDSYTTNEPEENIIVVQPNIQVQSKVDSCDRKRVITDKVLQDLNVNDFIAWYYTPMAYAFTSHLRPKVIVYDCMDELSAFLNAPAALIEEETRLLQAAAVVFTGGVSLYEAKKTRHQNVYCMPSSIDKDHFAKARIQQPDPPDQKAIGFPRFGFFGVVDERFDIELVKAIAERKPEWQLIIIGPVVKIDERTLPRLSNIHYLGMKQYSELPAYLSNWQIAIMPFAINDATRYISPTKTPEYLAAGKHVISTPIKDVVTTYGNPGMVAIAEDANSFIKAGERLLDEPDTKWMVHVDRYLDTISWDNLVHEMERALDQSLSYNKNKVNSYV